MQKQGGKQKHRRHFHKQQSKRSKVENDEIEAIERILAEQAPPRGTNPLALQAPAAAGAAGGAADDSQPHPGFAAAKRFDELPISEYSKQGLREAKYVMLTAVQRAALPHALCGRDVLGAAKTGSGKTLAFLLPVLEKLYRQRWGKLDGLGALVISPTRELALQIFDELRKVGRRHDLSAGLLIGGKDVKEEQARVHGMNILVCTPGRLLQHMDETPGFDASQLQALVLDEADRILDMGFSASLNAIVANIPRERQTLLFSATQTKSVKDLARLSLKDPEYVAVHAEAQAPTPLRLQQAYMVCELQQKLDILWSFIKTHLKAKTIVFVSTCKQVRFLFEAFRKLRPGVPLRALHGKMNQYKRMGVFYEFCEAKSMVLFATDIAARGLDFPTVDWVVQADCPEDVASYIHRVGRTARYVASGKGLLLLLPSEKDGMLAQLEEAKVPMKQLKHNPAKVQPVTPALQALLSKDAELKEVAQRALVSYLRSIFLQPNRKVFDVTQLPAAEFAYSMGLPTAPKLRFLKKAGKKMQEVVVGGGALAEAEAEPEGDLVAAGGGKKRSSTAGQEKGQKKKEQPAAANGAADSSDDEEEGSEGSGSGSEGEGGSDGEQANGQRRQAGAAGKGSGAKQDQEGQDDEDDFLVVKRRDVFEAAEEQAAAAAAAAAAEAEALEAGAGGKNKKKKPLKIKANRVSGTRVVFDEDGEAVDPLELLAQDDAQFQADEEQGAGTAGLDTGIHASAAERAAAARALMLQRDREDKEKLRELRKQMRQEKRAKRLAREAAAPGGVAVLAGAGSDDSDEESEDYSSGEEGSESEGSEGSDEEGGRVRQKQRRQGGGWGGAGSSDEDDELAGGAGSDLDLDLLESSDEEEEEGGRGGGGSGKPQRRQQRGGLPEVAHLGMLPAKQPQQQQQQQRGGKRAAAAAGEDEGPEEGLDQQQQQQEQQQEMDRRRKKKQRGVDAGSMSLAEQEALALKLLGAKR